MGNVTAIIVEDIRSEAGHAPGAIEVRSLGGEVRGFACRCPCGCGHEIWLPVKPQGTPDRGTRECWDWDGELKEPTLHPSVYNTGLPCKWHGYLRQGVWEPV